jgi:hypothetical protein
MMIRTRFELGIGSGVLVIKWGDDDSVSKYILAMPFQTC